MGVLKGEYIGFTYNGVHSSDLGIMRVSDGSRFSENLLPTMQDKTVQIPGGDGTYYFGSYYTQRQLSISFVFESLTETQIENLRKIFGDKKSHPLIFDERPYKTYYAKVTGTTTIKYVPFSQGETNRIYKGEGTIQFTCHQPYAVCTKKFLRDYPAAGRGEWAEASGLLENNSGIDMMYDKSIKVYNPGVKPADWKMFFVPTEERILNGGRIVLNDNVLQFKGCIVKGEDEIIVFDSKTKLIEGLVTKEIDSKGMVLSYAKSGNIYNEHITAGDFFDIPVSTSKNISNYDQFDFIPLDGNAGTLSDQFDSIKYNYYYF